MKMERKVRIGRVEQQDELRREDALKMTPAERMEALLRWRDRLFPYEPLQRKVTIRHFD